MARNEEAWRRKRKACPMCHRRMALDEKACECGYEFGQPIELVIRKLRGQRTGLAITCVMMLACIAGIGVAMVTVELSFWLYVGMLAIVVPFLGRTVAKLFTNNDSLQALQERAAATALPKAVARQIESRHDR